MLDAAFGNWTSSLSERGFDDTFLALLRANGFADVHFTHGQYEFGKDVIAKRTVNGVAEQHAFQSKSGDISGSVWDGIYSQMSELVGSRLTHPNFDASVRQVRHLVTTGRLTGKAIKAEAAKRGAEFVVDDQDTLLAWLSGLPASSTVASRSPELETVVGKIFGGDVTELELEEALGKLIPTSGSTETTVWRSLLDLSVCARALASRGRVLHSVSVLLHGIRLGAVISHADQKMAKGVMEASMRLYVGEGAQLLGPFLKAPESTAAWVAAIGGNIGIFVTYPITAVRVVEFLGLSALFQRQLGDEASAAKTIAVLATVVLKHPSCAHPVSDRAAASIAVGVAALAHFNELPSAENLLIASLKWVCDRYEDSDAGLAGPYAGPDEEVRTLLMAHTGGMNLPRRRESLLAVAIVDLAYSFLPLRYVEVLNEILATKIVPMSVHPNDHPDAYLLKRIGQTRPLTNVRYPDQAHEPVAHFGLQSDPRTPELAGGPAVSLALAAIVRDRLFSDVFMRLKSVGAIPITTTP